jgi:hypothetical protein
MKSVFEATAIEEESSDEGRSDADTRERDGKEGLSAIALIEKL